MVRKRLRRARGALVDGTDAIPIALEPRAVKDDERRWELAQNATQSVETAAETEEIARAASAKA